MKTLRLVFVFCFLSSITSADAQQYLTLSQKRTNLVSSLRILGPLDAPDWLSTLPLVAGNYGYVYSNPTFLYVGNYGYISLGPDPNHPGDTIYDYQYRNTGVWVGSDDPYLNNPYAMFAWNFGIQLPYIPSTGGNYAFTLNTAAYNVAGLRYESVWIVNGRSNNSALGWVVKRGGTSGNTGVPFNTAQTFDLGQNVEIPSFRISDYWYGPHYNYPQDSRAPSPQDTWRQSEKTVLVGTLFNRSTNVAWVQEGVYRPSFALQPGYSSPRLYTFMEQYFESAWKCDPTTGNLTRQSATNWNGVGKINTNSAVRTGSLLANGYYFTPTEIGKAILKTQPQENGFYGEVPFYALAMFVDKNRDGILNTNDVTTASDPHLFWVNNDCDRAEYTDDDLWDELDFDPVFNGTDAAFVRSNFRIPTLRDLEDYDQLHVRGLKELCRDLPTGQGYTVAMRWKSVQSGNPGIFVFKAVDLDGGRGYLTNATLAAAQITPSVYPPAGSPGISPLAIGRVEWGNNPILHNDNYRGTNDYFIYCGTSRGAGELAVTVYKDDTIIGETSVFLDLRDVKEFYERWTLGDGNGAEPAITPTPVTTDLPIGVPATIFGDGFNSGREYILFVHGWNMKQWEKDSFAETAFKRLYWQGYTNRFGSLRWPTTYGFNDSFTNLVFDLRNYDNGEFSAWRSGEGLRSHLVSLNQRYTGKVFMLAHSMGNVVAGEALALNAEKYSGGQIVNTYVASQAAVPLHCYNPNVPAPYLLDFLYTPPRYTSSVNWDSGTANVYQGWLATNRVSCGSRVNFYNLHDWALSRDIWQFNQAFKPDSGPYDPAYQYQRPLTLQLPTVSGVAGGLPTHVIPSPARKNLTPPSFRQTPGVFCARNAFYRRFMDFEYNLQDMYEVMAYASEARSRPLGIIGDEDAIPRAVNIQGFWPFDNEPDANNGSYGRHKWHSGQFRFNYVDQERYWRNLIGRNGFNIFTDR